MKVSKFMTRDVQLVTPTQTIRDVSRMMAELDAGSLPVQQDDRGGDDHRSRYSGPRGRTR